MTSALPAPPLLFITDRLSTPEDLTGIVRQVLEAGCRWIMIREKDLATAELSKLAEDIVSLARPFGGRVIINGDLDAALSSGAAGVHLPATGDIGAAREFLGEEALIGSSCHSETELRAAMTAGADYATLSPIFLTDSKPGYGPVLGIKGLRSVCASVSGPIIALAGISAANAADCLAAGAAGVAVMGGIMRAEFPADTTRHIIAAMGFDQARNTSSLPP